MKQDGTKRKTSKISNKLKVGEKKNVRILLGLGDIVNILYEGKQTTKTTT